MFYVETKNEKGEWVKSHELPTRGDAMNKTDVLFRFHGKDARAVVNGVVFYRREQGKSNARPSVDTPCDRCNVLKRANGTHRCGQCNELI